MNSATKCADQDPAPAAWFEDDSFWKASYPFLFPDEKFAAAEEQVSQLRSAISEAQGAPYDLNAERLIAVATKPKNEENCKNNEEEGWASR
jgi:hypothetical protein